MATRSQNNYSSSNGYGYSSNNGQRYGGGAGAGGSGANPFLDESTAQSPDDELGIVRSKILDVQHESKSSTQRSLALLHETDAIGSRTAEQLIEQGEQLTRVNRRMDDIDNNLKDSQKNVNKLKSIFGRFTNWKLDKSERKEAEERAKRQGQEADIQDGSSLAHTLGARPITGPTSKSWEATSASARRPHAGNAVEDEIDQNELQLEADLEDMGILTGRLKELALGMGDELERHNQMIDKLSTRVDKTDRTVAGQDKALQKVLGKK